jgi:hypothetical protein
MPQQAADDLGESIPFNSEVVQVCTPTLDHRARLRPHAALRSPGRCHSIGQWLVCVFHRPEHCVRRLRLLRGLEGMQVIGGALRMSGGAENEPLVVLQHLKP